MLFSSPIKKKKALRRGEIPGARAPRDKPTHEKNVALFMVKAARCKKKLVYAFSVNQHGNLKKKTM